VSTRAKAERIARFAFDFAIKNNRKVRRASVFQSLPHRSHRALAFPCLPSCPFCPSPPPPSLLPIPRSSRLHSSILSLSSPFFPSPPC
jgi:hypothetical protein